MGAVAAAVEKGPDDAADCDAVGLVLAVEKCSDVVEEPAYQLDDESADLKDVPSCVPVADQVEDAYEDLALKV